MKKNSTEFTNFKRSMDALDFATKSAEEKRRKQQKDKSKKTNKT
jgi:hypothetical protein